VIAAGRTPERNAEAAYRRYARHLSRCARCGRLECCSERNRLGARWQEAERLAGRRFQEARTA
jgi:hypothetical protein